MIPKLLVLDFDGVLTTNQVMVNEYGIESVLCSRADGFGIQAVQHMGIQVHCLSSEINSVVLARCKKLGIAPHTGHTDKLPVLKWLAAAFEISLAETAYVGNDVNDLACLQAVGYPYIVADAHRSLHGWGFRELDARGGYGAVRELCDHITAGTIQYGRAERAWYHWLQWSYWGL